MNQMDSRKTEQLENCITGGMAVLYSLEEDYKVAKEINKEELAESYLSSINSTYQRTAKHSVNYAKLVEADYYVDDIEPYKDAQYGSEEYETGKWHMQDLAGSIEFNLL